VWVVGAVTHPVIACRHTHGSLSSLVLACVCIAQRAEANALMASTETMMKFGFMSMSMTYFSSLNMIKAMRQVGTANTLFANPLVSAALLKGPPGSTVQLAAGAPSPGSALGSPTKAMQLITPQTVVGPENPHVEMWTVGDVAAWLETLSLGQYKHVFAEAAIDGVFLFDLSDEVRLQLPCRRRVHAWQLVLCFRRSVCLHRCVHCARDFTLLDIA
jgi:hypothetical protein